MINQDDLRNSLQTSELNRHFKNYLQLMGLKSNLEWEIRADTQIVSNCFPASDNTKMIPVLSLLQQSGIFIEVKVFNSKTQLNTKRIVLNTDNVTNLLDKFRCADYFNALLKVLPVTGLICIPSSLDNQLTIQVSSLKNSYKQVPLLLNLLKMCWEVSPSNQITIPCLSVATLITQQKQVYLDYLLTTIKGIDNSIKLFDAGTNIHYLSSGNGEVRTTYSKNFWETTPGMIFEFKKNYTTLQKLREINPEVLEVKLSGYYDNDPLMPCGVRLNRYLDIPFAIKDIAFTDIRKINARNNYLDCLLTFKGKTKEYGFSSLPYEVSKKILLLTDDKSSLLTENEKSELIDSIKDYKFM